MFQSALNSSRSWVSKFWWFSWEYSTLICHRPPVKSGLYIGTCSNYTLHPKYVVVKFLKRFVLSHRLTQMPVAHHFCFAKGFSMFSRPCKSVNWCSGQLHLNSAHSCSRKWFHSGFFGGNSDIFIWDPPQIKNRDAEIFLFNSITNSFGYRSSGVLLLTVLSSLLCGLHCDRLLKAEIGLDP